MKRTVFLITVLLQCACLCRAQTVSKSTDVHAHMSRAEAALRANDQETAAREFRAVLAINPKNAAALTNLGVMEFFRGDCASAIKDLNQAVALTPSLEKARALLGVCQKRMGDPAAQKNLETAFAQLKDAKLRTRIGMELAGLYQQAGDLEHVASTMGALVAINPEDPNILYFAQRTYSELADSTLDKLAVVAPASARMQQVIAERLVNSGDLKGAIEHYRKVLEIDPHIEGVRYELAEAILQSAPLDGEIQSEAEKELREAMTQEGDGANLECELASIAAFRANLQDAYKHYAQAFRINPDSACAQLGLGRTLMTMEKPEEARKYLELAVKSDPLNNEAHYRLGLAYRKLQMPEQAQREMLLFQDIKKTRDQVESLYHQMHREPKSDSQNTSDLPKE
jgi:tetratricopeptide (TPR) repeat protein